MPTGGLSQPWGPVVTRTQGFASPVEVDSYAQILLQKQAEAGSEPDSNLGSYVTSVLRETDAQVPVTELPEYENLRELIQEQCWLDSEKAASVIDQISTCVRTRQIPSTQQSEQVVVSPNAERTLIPGNMWGDNTTQSPRQQGSNTVTQQPDQSDYSYPALGSSGRSAHYNPYNAHTAADDPYQIEQAFESSVEILLSMNPDISEDAARQALQLVQGDVNWGQYMVDVALTAPPVCRHLLNDGCYRRDCQFSHDIDGHTCVFWLQGRCGKGASCPFRHGFDEKALEAVMPPASTEEQYPPLVTEEDPPLSSTPTTTSTSNTQGSIWSRTSSTSFAQVASQGGPPDSAFPSLSLTSKMTTLKNIRRVDIPQDLWNAHENREAAVFYIADPLERYHAVSSTVRRQNVIDLHFQSTKTFSVVLQSILPSKLADHSEVWIVTGTGHHVGSRTHQKGGGALENVVVDWLTEHGYKFARGRDRNGLGGALLVQR
mmetsp:Transcript_21858/g.41344  ORF Transcript_21858/g.41344 Transcript_21858/m.41344 type:complete len:488 (-) Transcript_21858:70-1533(-)|eukprot:scaffold758_cov177-Amphora_coffeaeformis.AAC.6